jgi:putative ABC transport system substrate-binding protein
LKPSSAGHSFIIEHRDARGGFEGLSATFEALVQLPVDVIVVSGSESVQAARQATQTIPVVFTNVGDPIEQGFIASHAKPGRNITGVTNMVSELTAKWLEIFTELQSRIKRVAVLWNPPQPAHRGLLNAMQSAASTLGLQLRGAAHFGRARRENVEALTMLGSFVHFRSLRQIADFAQQVRLPTVAWTDAFTQVGGLVSYGVAEAHQWRRVATYVDRIIKGAHPADLPVERPTKFALVVNLKTAKILGLTIPPSLLLRADQVIE